MDVSVDVPEVRARPVAGFDSVADAAQGQRNLEDAKKMLPVSVRKVEDSNLDDPTLVASTLDDGSDKIDERADVVQAESDDSDLPEDDAVADEFVQVVHLDDAGEIPGEAEYESSQNQAAPASQREQILTPLQGDRQQRDGLVAVEGATWEPEFQLPKDKRENRQTNAEDLQQRRTLDSSWASMNDEASPTASESLDPSERARNVQDDERSVTTTADGEIGHSADAGQAAQAVSVAAPALGALTKQGARTAVNAYDREALEGAEASVGVVSVSASRAPAEARFGPQGATQTPTSAAGQGREWWNPIARRVIISKPLLAGEDGREATPEQVNAQDARVENKRQDEVVEVDRPIEWVLGPSSTDEESTIAKAPPVQVPLPVELPDDPSDDDSNDEGVAMLEPTEKAIRLGEEATLPEQKQVVFEAEEEGPTKVNAVQTERGEYTQAVDAQINERWNILELPPSERGQLFQGFVTVSFTIEANGRLSDVQVIRASGNAWLDALAKQALSEKVQRIPKSLGTTQLKREITFRYRDP
ncbi:MAG: TonB family protein [Rhodobacterales bacterium]|nr:TonB family protein [Rhodobacterales bacterium]